MAGDEKGVVHRVSDGGVTGTHPDVETRPLLVAPATGSEFNAAILGLIPVGCWKRLIRAWEGACIACGRGDIPLDARHFRRGERVATCFDSRNVAGQCAKENRFEGGKLYKFSLAIGEGIQQQPFPLFKATQELDQLKSAARVRPPFAILSDTLTHGIPADAGEVIAQDLAMPLQLRRALPL